MSSTPNFRVIIVGGGPVGLTAAHMFSKAGIDYVLLERRDTVTPQNGSSLAVTPQTLRVYDQLDLLEPTRKVNHPLHVKHIVTSSGGLLYNTTYIYDWVVEE
jgi:2-polyprenyl-6-methoxyphenol hydroxylase-like FAD-dependent oxidoreductase